MAERLSTPVRRLGVLTGGGDVPGLNVAIKALVSRAEDMGISVLGLRKGWEGITFLDRSRKVEDLAFRYEDPSTWDNYVVPLTRLNTRSIDRTGGTILGSTRTNPANVKVSDLPAHLASYGQGKAPGDRVDLTDAVIKNMEYIGLDGIVVIGGDDTQSFGAVLDKRGVPAWGIPKTMDNDVPGTDYCIGFYTAIVRGAEFINRIRSTAGSHQETILFRMFGRDAGFTALETAIVAAVDRVLIPESPANIDRLAELIAHDRMNPHNYSFVILSEGANLGMPVPEEGPADAYGHRKKVNIAEFLAKELARRMPTVRFLPLDLTYILRAGEAEAYDKRMAAFFANLICSEVEAKRHGVMAAHREGRFILTDIPGKNFPARGVDPNDYHPTLYRPYYERITGAFVPQSGRSS
jgi:ATP-dependent phosphofructokinase / diphosphate-dependent phosphofructokinase